MDVSLRDQGSDAIEVLLEKLAYQGFKVGFCCWDLRQVLGGRAESVMMGGSLHFGVHV